MVLLGNFVKQASSNVLSRQWKIISFFRLHPMTPTSEIYDNARKYSPSALKLFIGPNQAVLKLSSFGKCILIIAGY